MRGQHFVIDPPSGGAHRPLNWDETRTKIGWYRDVGGTRAVVLNTIPSYLGGEVTEAAFTDAMQAASRAAAVGADEMHISLNLGTPVSPDRQGSCSPPLRPSSVRARRVERRVSSPPG
jgi:hypothetical protein